MDSLSDARKNFTEGATFLLDGEQLSRTGCEALKKTLQEFYGDCPVTMTIHFPRRGEVDIDVPKDMTIRPCMELRQRINQLEQNIQLSYQIKKVEARARGNGKGSWSKGA